MLAFLAASLASVPVWLAVSARVGKKRAWLVGMGSSAVAYLGSLPYLHPSFFPRSSEVRFAYLVLVAVALGFCSASGSVVGTSLQADVVSWDEATTGERKEGVYFAWWNFLTKTGSGVVTMVRLPHSWHACIHAKTSSGATMKPPCCRHVTVMCDRHATATPPPRHRHRHRHATATPPPRHHHAIAPSLRRSSRGCCRVTAT